MDEHLCKTGQSVTEDLDNHFHKLIGQRKIR